VRTIVNSNFKNKSYEIQQILLLILFISTSILRKAQHQLDKIKQQDLKDDLYEL
jgi:hypothetical protein